MDDQPKDAGAETPEVEATASPEATPPAPEPSAPATPPAETPPEGKNCVWCGEVLPIFADRCSHCSGFLPIAEGRAFGQHFFFFVASLAIFLGTLLPWEGAWYDSHGYRSTLGGFLLLFAGYGMVAAFFNIFHRRMIVWPVVLAALEGTWLGWKRVFQLTGSEAANAIEWSGDMAAKKKAIIEFSRLFGPGLWLVVIFSTLFWLVFVFAVIQGGRAAGARKEAEKAARAARRGK
jgi:hypothetical protein